MQGMMSSVANIATDSAELSFKNWMSALSLHVISRFIEISDSWNVALFLLAQNVSVVVDVHRTVVEGLFVLFSFED